jgi:5-methylcytosine-specific restriction endonuclease McrA
MPIDYKTYAEDWREISLRVRHEAGWRCEVCGAKQFDPHPITGSTVILTVAHLDHSKHNNDRNNLKAMCQRCHLRYDAGQHAESRRRGSHG